MPRRRKSTSSSTRKKLDYGKTLHFASGYGRKAPLLIQPHGPSQPWMVDRSQGPSSSRRAGFGSERAVNSRGYLSFWNGGSPTQAPPSWNYNLKQDRSSFDTGMDFPTLSQVVSQYGKKPRLAH